MPKTLLGYIFRHSARQQLIVLIATASYLPMLYVTFELPKVILNQAIGGNPAHFPKTLLGVSFTQFGYLITLSVALFVLILLAGALRYWARTYKGVIGEMLLRRLRLDIYNQILRFPLSRLRRVTGGEIIAMSTAEVEPIGRYMGIAVANPTLLGGTLITAMVFLFVQDWILGLAAVALFPVQGWLIPILQRKINLASRGRIESTRRFAAHVSETMQGLRDIRANHTVAFETATLRSRLGAIFARGREIYSRTSVLIFINYFFNHLTPVLFYSIGGVLVLRGSLTIGALVAVIAAFRETAAPWNELLENYQQLQENRLKYQALIENFNLEDDATSPSTLRPGDGPLVLSGVTVQDEGATCLDAVSLTLPVPGAVAVTGSSDSGRVELAELLAGLRKPAAGTLTLGGADMGRMSADTLGRAVAYADAQAFIFTGTWYDALVYGLKRPAEAANPPEDADGEWIDYAQAGVADRTGLIGEIRRALDAVGLTEDVRAQGLRRGVPPGIDADYARRLLAARRALHAALRGQTWAQGVEIFDRDRFMENATLAENLLFGRPLDDTLGVRNLGAVPEFMAVIERHGLTGRLIDMGREAAATILQLFNAVPAGDERLQRLSLIAAEDFPIYQAILARHQDAPAETIAGEDRRLLLAVAFSVAPAHQRLGLMDDDMRARIVAARKDVLAEVAPKLAGKHDPFDPDRVTANITVQCNVLYGRLDRRDNRFWPEVRSATAAAMDQAGLSERVLQLGLETPVGTAGGLLSQDQKQRLAIARGLLKRPKIFVVNDALTALDAGEQAAVARRVANYTPRFGLIWVGAVPAGAEDVFESVCTVKQGRIDAGGLAAAEGPRAGADATIEDEARLLASIPALAGVRAESLRLMAYAAEHRTFAPGDALIREGERSVDVFVLLDGAADVTVGTPGRLVGHVGAGAFLGEVAAIAGLPRTANVIATEATTALVLSRDVFLDLLRRDQGLGHALLRDLATRVVLLAGELSKAQSA